MAPTSQSTPARQPGSSPELGSPSHITQYNKQTGRPVRRSAGKAHRRDGYIDSSLINDDSDESETYTSDDTDEDSKNRGRGRKSNMLKTLKRKRTPSPPSPRLEPIIYDQVVEDMTDDETGTFDPNSPKNKSPVTLQFNVPLGFHGPLFVKLDGALLKDNEEGKGHDMQKRPKKKIRAKAKQSDTQSTKQDVTEAVKGTSFLDLPPELRNTVYRMVFVKNPGVSLRIPQRHGSSGLSRSAQFLRTCKVIHDEGCSVLYGENEFYFDRHHGTRAPFWQASPKEIGYQDFLHFLKMIGPENLQYLRDIRIDFDDALPKFMPLTIPEDRRFVVDEYLVNCFRILRGAKLRTIKMLFYGRRQILQTDTKFLSYLAQVKADQVTKLNSPYMPTKIAPMVWFELQSLMARKKKLYEKE